MSEIKVVKVEGGQKLQLMVTMEIEREDALKMREQFHKIMFADQMMLNQLETFDKNPDLIVDQKELEKTRDSVLFDKRIIQALTDLLEG